MGDYILDVIAVAAATTAAAIACLRNSLFIYRNIAELKCKKI